MPTSRIDRRGLAVPPAPAWRLIALAVGLLIAANLAWPADAPAKRAKAPPREFFGVSAVSPTAADFTGMGQAKVGTYRLALAWHAVQPVRDQPYDWSRSDFEIGNAASNGVQPFVFLSGAPPFAGATGDTAPVGSTDAQQGWQRFVAAAVQRYGPGGQFWAENPGLPNRPVRAWQIWNEQNAAFFWHPTPSPPDYAQLLKLSSSAIRSVDPNAQIVLGGMYGFPHLAGSIPMTGFLKRLYRIRSVRRHFDAVALHPYAGTVRAVKFQIDRARRIMDKFRDRRTPIWITELSWSTDGPPDWPLVTTPTRQAKLLKKSFKLLLKRRKSDRIRQVTWFAWRDNNDPECKWCPGAGLLDLQGNPKPSLSQFRRFTARTR